MPSRKKYSNRENNIKIEEKKIQIEKQIFKSRKKYPKREEEKN